jgi:hypothetical protein
MYVTNLKRKFLQITGLGGGENGGDAVRAKLEAGTSQSSVVPASANANSQKQPIVNQYSETLKLSPRDVLAGQTLNQVTMRLKCPFVITPQTEFSRIKCEREHLVIERDLDLPEARLRALIKLKAMELNTAEPDPLVDACVRCFLMINDDEKVKITMLNDGITFATKRIWKREVAAFHEYCPGKEITVTPLPHDRLFVAIRT